MLKSDWWYLHFLGLEFLLEIIQKHLYLLQQGGAGAVDHDDLGVFADRTGHGARAAGVLLPAGRPERRFQDTGGQRCAGAVRAARAHRSRHGATQAQPQHRRHR